MAVAVRTVRDAFSGLLDLIYPPHCLICRAEGDRYLCAKCIELIDFIKPPFCRKCGGLPPSGPTPGGLCGDCRDREYHFEAARSACIYEGVVRDAIHALKYQNHVAIAEPLGEMMVEALPELNLPARIDLAIPIPIHRSRTLRRGFNQSEELARIFCNRMNLTMDPHVLRKAKKTKRQMELPFDLRVTNIRGAFAVTRAERVRGERILLIDDVFTTGSTLDEAARVLLEAGAKEVYAYTLAKSL